MMVIFRSGYGWACLGDMDIEALVLPIWNVQSMTVLTVVDGIGGALLFVLTHLSMQETVV